MSMQRAVAGQREGWRGRGLPMLEMRVGVNTGEAIVGNLGAEKYMNYTVVGDAVNVACRLQQAAGPGQVLVSGAVKERLREGIALRELPRLWLKGKSERVAAYEVELDRTPGGSVGGPEVARNATTT